jgi:transposase
MESITRVGIDVAQEWLDVLIERPHAKVRRFRNDLEGVAQLKAELSQGSYVIALEATGRYESLVRHELTAAGHRVRVKNPRQTRQLAHGLGGEAKTDPIDAKMLAETAELGRSTEPRSREREGLGDLSRTIEALKKERARHMKRIQVPGFSSIAIGALKSVVKAIDAEIKNLEKRFIELVKKGSLAERYELALSVPGVGPVLARVAVCELPEKLDEWSVRQLSSYAGVAAIDDNSGKRLPVARVPSHGNSHLKAGLYMPAMALIVNQEWAKTTYRRLRGNARTHQQAIIAVMHRLLIHIIAVLKRGSAWQTEPPKGLTNNHTI